MHAIEPADWTSRQSELWDRIAGHAFERPDHPFDFTRRLARDRGWSLPFARGAVIEYQRFCFLAALGIRPVTPSEEVDEVWHQHLTYSRDYWQAWCGRALGVPLHHDPTEGGPAEGARFRRQYADTLALYEAYFGLPDPAYWPATHRRFRARPRFCVVDRDRALVLPRPRWAWKWAWTACAGGALRALDVTAAAGVAILYPHPALALPLNPFDWPAAPFLTLYGALAAATVAFVFVMRSRLRGARGAGPPAEAAADGLGLLHLAWLGGGRERASDLVLAGLVDAGAAQVASRRLSVGAMKLLEIEVDDRNVTLPEPFAAFRGLARGGLSRAAFSRAIAGSITLVEADLTRRALVPAPERILRARLRIAAVVGAVAVFGAIKVVVGTARDKPVGYLAFLLFSTVIAATFATLLTPTRTRLGAAVLRLYRERYNRAATSPRPHEVLFAFALSGAAVLTGTHLDDLGRILRTSQNGGGDSGSGGGDGGSGGGCGGCGGGGD